ncbi:hypothetical protein DPEC_G00308490 [Dallia pectoralis]|uniref:Uncharacterized protein n=1 Tax=Dallia pectoralis TaxID=75939 RepID=A0ACC2FEU1_DALPE|nr:hypothetical protein DPEC_G00308490 [Dallia pectoralis]
MGLVHRSFCMGAVTCFRIAASTVPLGDEARQINRCGCRPLASVDVLPTKFSASSASYRSRPPLVRRNQPEPEENLRRTGGESEENRRRT